MVISTRGRYALRVMVDLAKHAQSGFVSLNEVARRQGISRKYLESIASALGKAELINSKRGKDGGYRLSRPAEDVSVGSVLAKVERGLAPAACVGGRDRRCDRAEDCPTLPLWKGLDTVVEDYLERVTIADLLENSGGLDA